MDEPRSDKGEVGDEVSRLVSAVQDWARKAFVEPTAGSADGPARHSGGECLPWCPICQFANVLRGEHPEIGQRVAEAGTAIAAAMKALADATVARAADSGGADRPRPSPRVQHIRLDDPDEG